MNGHFCRKNLYLLSRFISFDRLDFSYYSSPGQVSAWQSAALLPISCKSAQPVPAWVEEPVSPVRKAIFQWFEQSTLSQDALSQRGKVGCQNWHNTACSYSATGGEHDQQQTILLASLRPKSRAISKRLCLITLYSKTWWLFEKTQLLAQTYKRHALFI